MIILKAALKEIFSFSVYYFIALVIQGIKYLCACYWDQLSTLPPLCTDCKNVIYFPKKLSFASM